jgi:tetratricopeptide (TPR) repeat protein
VVDSSVVQANNIDTVNIGRPRVRSAYLEQVRRIAPEYLSGRNAERAELTAFCTAPDGPTYRWYRAAAWAGKSALMSWFVLQPPDGVRVVSFFITARYAGQSDRIAFVDVVLEQLADLLGQPMPAYLTEATRDAHLLSMLATAAEQCAARNERLILVVDGLDEDRGVTTGPDAHSIAALLPANPAAGMRVIVAGRPNPPVPADVPYPHPLRDLAIAYPLTASPHAATIKIHAEQELKRLLHGTLAEQDLLGLVAAAGGGLSAADLAELTGRPAWEVSDELTAVSGRTFMPEMPRWIEGEVYVLAHEELQQAATTFLGAARLTEYRTRLHTWAEGYCEWPPGTPEYLLRGYLRLLQETGDIPRMLALATNQARHDRMLDITGGDATALTEITTTQQSILDQPEIDLTAMARLAVQRGRLLVRNTAIPDSLPAVWAALGARAKAEALADSITDPTNRVRALHRWALHMVARGDLHAATEPLARAVTVAHTISDPALRDRAIELVREAVLACGDITQAEAMLDRLGDDMSHDDIRHGLMRIAAVRGQIDRAVTFACDIDDEQRRTDALSKIVKVATDSGDLGNAVHAARSIPDAPQQELALQDIVRAALSAGDIDRAETTAGSMTFVSGDLDNAVRAIADTTDAAEAHARAIKDPLLRQQVLAALVPALVASGQADRAESIAESLDPRYRGPALIALVTDRATRGDYDQAEQLLTRLTATPLATVQAACALATALAGDPERAQEHLDRAEQLADSISALAERVEALIALIAASSDVDRMSRHSLEAMALVPSLGIRARVVAVRNWFDVLVSAGQASPAFAHALSFTDTAMRVSAMQTLLRIVVTGRATSAFEVFTGTGVSLSSMQRAAAETGDAERAEYIARTIADPTDRNSALRDLAKAFAELDDFTAARVLRHPIASPSFYSDQALYVLSTVFATFGDLDRAESVALRPDDGYFQALALAEVALAAISRDDRERAARLAEQAAKETRSYRSHTWPGTTRLGEVAAVCDIDRARALTDRVEAGLDPNDLIKELCTAVRMAAAIDDRARAGRLLSRIADMIHGHTEPEQYIPQWVEAMAAAGEFDQAEILADSIATPAEQARALASLAEAAAKAGEFPTVSRLVGWVVQLSDSIASQYRRGRVLATIVGLMAVDDLHGAEVVARSIVDPTDRTCALADLAGALATDGQIERAEQILGSLPEQDTRQRLDSGEPGVVATIRALTGDPERAEALARSITAPDDQARGLAAVAMVLPPDQARRLVGEALQIAEDWTIPLGALAKVDREALNRIVDDLLAGGE